MEHPCQSDLRGQGNHKNLYNLCRICTIAIYFRSRFHAIFVRIFVFRGHCSLRVYHKSLCRHHGNLCEPLWATSKSKFVQKWRKNGAKPRSKVDCNRYCAINFPTNFWGCHDLKGQHEAAWRLTVPTSIIWCGNITELWWQ